MSKKKLLSDMKKLTAALTVTHLCCQDGIDITEAATTAAFEINQPMCVSVCDASGNEVFFARMDNAWVGSIDISKNKAVTAASFKLSTKELSEKAQPGEEFYGIQHSNNGKIMVFAGGVPIFDSAGNCIGAIGVSGGSGEQDQLVAEAGARVMMGRV